MGLCKSSSQDHFETLLIPRLGYAGTLYSEQMCYVEKIKPIQQNGHLLLVTLLLSNMIVNETLLMIVEPVLGGGVQAVVVSTVLIVL